MSRMQSDESSKAQIRVKLRKDLKERFKGACETADVSMSDALREYMGEFADEHNDIELSDSDGFYPSDTHLCELYDACLEFATHDLKIYQKRHASSIAKETQQVTKNELPSALMPLRQQGFVALGAMPIDLSGEAADRWRHWHIKPACADPEQWKYRENHEGYGHN